MKPYLFRKTVYNCKQATQLALKKEEGDISLAERAKLFYHLLYCYSCRFFVKQSRLIDQTTKRVMDEKLESPPYQLSDEKKKAIQHELNILDR
jgi:hypothetical protein